MAVEEDDLELYKPPPAATIALSVWVQEADFIGEAVIRTSSVNLEKRRKVCDARDQRVKIIITGCHFEGIH